MEFLISFNNQLKIALWIVFCFFGRPTHFNSTKFCCSEKKKKTNEIDLKKASDNILDRGVFVDRNIN